MLYKCEIRLSSFAQQSERLLDVTIRLCLSKKTDVIPTVESDKVTFGS